MIHKLYKSLSALTACCAALVMASCSNDLDGSGLVMDGDCFVTSLTVNGKAGTIDNEKKTVMVYQEPGTDLTALPTEYTLSVGATADIASGSIVNYTSPVLLKVTNGNTYIDYTVSVECYKAMLSTLTLTASDGKRYNGIIDHDALTVKVYLPLNTDMTRLSVSYTVFADAKADVAQGAVLDLSNSVGTPLPLTVTNHGETRVYMLTAGCTDMPVTAFIGTAASVGGLNDEEKAAAEWMLSNVPRSVYIAMPDIISGAVQLDPAEVPVLWWHLDDNNWPSVAWDSHEKIAEYYGKGGNLMLSRYACKYAKGDCFGIARDGSEPGVQNSDAAASVLETPLGFYVDEPEHAIFSGLGAVKNEQIFLIGAGAMTKNSQTFWNIWDYPDHSLEGWMEATGGLRLAFEPDDSNKTAIVEFAPRGKNGRVITVGTGGFEWNTGDNNMYAANRATLTMNILRYLAGIE